MLQPREKYNSLAIQEPTPEGTAYIIIVEEEPGKIAFINTHIGKAGTSLRSYTFAIDELVSALFSRGSSITEVIELLTDISSDRAPRLAAGGSYNRSYAEALANALRKYLNSLDVVPEGEKKFARLAPRGD